MSDVVDTTATEVGTELAAPAPAPTLELAPTVTAADLVARLSVIGDAMHTAMKDGVDYGRIPGVEKPTLLKPGAEKLGVLFQLDVQIKNEQTWGPGDHLTVTSRATVYHAPTGTRLGYGEGVCSTREKKYGKRRADRVCPHCSKPAIIKGRKEYGGGWVCFKKKEGCGAKFQDGDPSIEGQAVGDVENPDLPDTWNTVTKMAEKRARVDAVLAVTGASALFTQDAEDITPAAPPAPPAPANEFSGTFGDSRPLSDAGREKIAAAIAKAGMDQATILKAAGFSSLAEVSTVGASHKVRTELDKAVLSEPAVTVDDLIAQGKLETEAA